ncbi:MAG: glycosyltransferase family 1 protein [bacterium]|nr:glycosyltransferase family 1 protein [bacterium]
MVLQKKHRIFKGSARKHIIIITNHGCHAPVITVTTDTGGQNFYVNDLSYAFVNLGYKVTILSRGGYKHPVTGKLHKGSIYYNKVWPGKKGNYCRVIYLEDKQKKFVPKENLKQSNLEQEKNFFFRIAQKNGIDLKNIYLISSHYWDAGILGILINDELEKKHKSKVPHIWTSHSLGILKKKNFKKAPKKLIQSLKFPSRIKFEKKVISTVDAVVSTSNKINSTLSEYNVKMKNHFWMPPGVDTRRFRSRKINQCKRGLKLLGNLLRMEKKEVINILRSNVVFLEASRTAKSKRKIGVLKSFARIKNRDQAFLIINVDPNTKLYERIKYVYDHLKYNKNILLVDRRLKAIEMQQIFSLSNVYITASVMEGWGMAVQEAAASKCAIISSKYVPFVTEILKDNVLLVTKNFPRLYAEKIDIMIQEPHLREKLANKCYKITSKHYGWEPLTKKLLLNMKKKGIIN